MKIVCQAVDFVRTKVSRIAPTFYLVILAAILLIQLSSSWIPTRDGTAYLSIAKSLASGNGLLRFGSPHLHFAPGYPVLIAPAFLFSDQPFLLISWIHWLLLVAFIWGTYLWSKRHIPEQAVLVAALCAINVGALYYFRRTLSEAAFMPLLVWTALLMDRTADAQNNVRAVIFAVAAALLGGYLCVVRVAGVTLAAGFALLISVQTIKHRTGIRAVGCASLVLATTFGAALLLIEYDRAMASASDTASSYFDELIRPETNIYQRILTGLLWRIQEIGRLTIPGAFKAYGNWTNPVNLVYLPLFAAFLVGWHRVTRRCPSSLLYAFPFYFGLYVLWPHDQGTRFMTPLVPVLWVSLLEFIFRSRYYATIVRFSGWFFVACLATSMAYFTTDRLELRNLSSYWAITHRMSALIPTPAQIGFIRSSGSFSANSFGSICTVKFDRRCKEIHDLKALALEPQIQYVAILGAQLTITGFGLVVQSDELSVLRRIQPLPR